MAVKSEIIWSPKQVLVKDIKPTEKNYKIKTDLGKERLQASLKSFGIAGTVIVNTDLMLIDGNSRLEEMIAKGAKKIWVSYPNRRLTPKEFTEMSAMYDFAKAGEVDMARIEADLGTSADFFNKYKMTIPLSLLENLGKNAPIKGLEYPEEGSGQASPEQSDILMVQLFFTVKQETEFRKMEEVLKKKLKTDNTTDTVFKALKAYTYGKK